VLDELRSRGDAASLEIVATIAYFKNQSMLGLPVMSILDNSRGINYMRVDGPAPYSGCDLFPIAVNASSYSLYPSNYDGPSMGDDGDSVEKFPFYPEGNYGNQSYYWIGKGEGLPHPTYTMENSLSGPFAQNRWGIHMSNARPGYIYKIKDDNAGPGNFGWLRWNSAGAGNSATDLGASLTYPGNSFNYSNTPWSDNGKVDRFDLIAGSTGVIAGNDIKNQLQSHVERGGRTLRLLVFTPQVPGPLYNNGDAGSPISVFPNLNGAPDGYGTGGSGSNMQYEVYGFVIVRLLAYHASNGNPGTYLLVEFVRFDVNCD
jgi:hypothetical protein